MKSTKSKAKDISLGSWGIGSNDWVFPCANKEHLLACGLPYELPNNWQKVFLRAFDKALTRYRSLKIYLDTCVRCGACEKACNYNIDPNDPKSTPLGRLELVRKFYKQHYGIWGQKKRGTNVKWDLSVQTLFEWYRYFYECGMCRRCALVCPLGIDVSEVTRALREVLAEVGLTPLAIAKPVRNYLAFGNSLGSSPKTWTQQNILLEESLSKDLGFRINCPVDEYGAQVLFLPSASDLLLYPYRFASYAKIFHAAGVSYTTSTYASCADNPGFFLNYRNMSLINQRILDAARELKVSAIIWGESGHGWYVGRNFTRNMHGSWKGLKHLASDAPLHFDQWVFSLWRKGAFDTILQRQANDDHNVILHDSCHAARSTDLLHEPRSLIKACCNFFTEMPSEVSGHKSYCCGFGGGLQELHPKLSREARKPLLGLLAYMNKIHGADCVATTCSNCAQSISMGISEQGMDMKVVKVSDLFANALYPSAESAKDVTP